MSTRGAVGFKLDGEYKVVYNHGDSYPSFLGAKVVNFCEEMEKRNLWEYLSHQVAGIEECEDRLTHAEEGINFLWGTFEGSVRKFQQYLSFMSDGLFCEYGYIIDLDELQLKFYRGLRDSAGKTDLPFPMVADEWGYYPCQLVFALPFDGLPSSWKKAYEKDYGQYYGVIFPEYAKA